VSTPVVSRSVGSFLVHALIDAVGPLETRAREAFPGATEEDWARARELDPAAFGPDDAWVLPFRAFLLRGPDDSLTIVDLGVGTASSPAAEWAPAPGTLPDVLAGIGVSPDDVGLVVLTHLHEDHVGWVVGPEGRPLFANAQHVVQAAEVDAFAADRVIRAVTVEPLEEAGLLRTLDGRTTLRPGLVAEPTPGHTLGHQSVWLTSGDDVLLVAGDVLVHAVQLLAPEVAYRAEQDPSAAWATRTRILAEAKRRGAYLATAHLTDPFVVLP
jgi:glyoxylase-like metal-dependent hydrolase (beta-lactamase superfamily II)